MRTIHNRSDKRKAGGILGVIALCLAALAVCAYALLPKTNGDDREPISSVPSPSSASSAVTAPEPVSSAETPILTVTATDKAVSDGRVLTTAAPFFTMPVTGEILKGFDTEKLQYSETYKDWRLHTGIDIAAAKGTKVLSCAQGVVTDCYKDPVLGQVVAVDHGGGIIAFYCGLNEKPVVKAGDKVEAGTQLGVIAAIPGESVEQAHLHLEIEKNGEPIAPTDLFATR